MPTTSLRRCAGYTLIEIVIAVAVIAILCAVANQVAKAAAASARSSISMAAMHSALVTAQRTSFARYQHVVLCSSADGTSCSGSNQWEHGWIAFVDANGDRQHQPDERVILREPAAAKGQFIRTSDARTRLVFQPHGGASAGSNATFVFCSSDTDKVSALVLANSGRIRQETPDAGKAAYCN